LINGKAINVEGGNYRMVNQNRIFECKSCTHTWAEERGTGRPRQCPRCKKNNLHRKLQDC
jgi:rubrerythrin